MNITLFQKNELLKQTVSRVLFPELFVQGNGHSSKALVTQHLKQPTRELRAGNPTYAPLFGLAPDGVYQALNVTIETGELLPHRFTLTHLYGRSIFCGTFLPVTKTGCYPAPCPMELGLSSRPYIIERATILPASAVLFLESNYFLSDSPRNTKYDYKKDNS